ncbi:Protein of uncharacterised function (DUF3592) [Legionella busanensis]|uniref:Protein of uncharacterized function (DUF3592) n=1 Tax=Legionella busanensis TaxID=190655 RepID=A0A378JPR0_9GAMM|nr:DUF3592 domain-containing protein [Legionella busanensis]STX50112.1 Protein of uncharacterised function (DUF3592) [Legionella busanensis]
MLGEFISWRGAADITWLLLLLLLLKHFWHDRQTLLKARTWFLTKGRITRFLWTRDGYHLWPKIEYTYQVYDKDFLGEYFFLDTSHNNPNSKYSRRVAYRAAVAFEKDEDIDVFYNPIDPQQAVLDVKIPTKLNFIIVLLACLILVHLGIIARQLF